MFSFCNWYGNCHGTKLFWMLGSLIFDFYNFGQWLWAVPPPLPHGSSHLELNLRSVNICNQNIWHSKWLASHISKMTLGSNKVVVCSLCLIAKKIYISWSKIAFSLLSYCVQLRLNWIWSETRLYWESLVQAQFTSWTRHQWERSQPFPSVFSQWQPALCEVDVWDHNYCWCLHTVSLSSGEMILETLETWINPSCC